MSPRRLLLSGLLVVVSFAADGTTAELAPRLRRPVGLQLSPDERLLYVANARSGSLSIVDVTAGVVVREIELGRQISDLKRLPDGDELLATDADATSREVEGAEESQRLMNCVNELDDDCREVLLLYYYQEVTYADLAELLGVSPATINARLTRARATLRERLRSVRT